MTRLLLLLVAFVATASAVERAYPLLTVDPQQETLLALADLGLPEDAELLPPIPPHVEASITQGELRLFVADAFPWAVLRTTAGDLLLRTSRKRRVRFSYSDQPGREDVFLFGNFNGWNRESHPMHEEAPGQYHRSILLPPGEHEYLLKVGDREMRDPANPDSVGNGLGGWNSLHSIRESKAGNPQLFRLGGNPHELRYLLRMTGETLGEFIQPEGFVSRKCQVFALSANQLLDGDAISWSGDTLAVRADRLSEQELRVAVTCNGHGSPLQTSLLSADFHWQDAIVYALMPDRFCNGDTSNDNPVSHPELLPPANWHGGDLAGVTQKLREGYFERLGVNAFWIYPLNRSTDKAWREYPEPHRWYTGYHGYWPVSAREMEPRFGTEEQFKTLVDEAHGREMRVLLDLVANHVHEEHTYFRNHPEWFGELELPDGSLNLRSWDEHRLTTWFEPYMPDVDYDGSQQALEVFTDDAIWWLQHYNLDGFRHDAVKHVPRCFWQRLTQKLRDTGRFADCYQIGETFGSDALISSYVGPAVLDAQFNFNLFHPARRIFLQENTSFVDLAALLEQNLEHYGRNHLMGNLMDSHDKARYMGFADGDLPLDGANLAELAWTSPPTVDHAESYRKAEFYLAYMFSLPGVPFLYYGDEIGMTGSSDPDNRRMMRFGDDLSEEEGAMFKAVSRLVHKRKDRVELRRGDFVVLRADQDVIAWYRSAERPDGSLSASITILNKGEQDAQLELRLPCDGSWIRTAVGPLSYRIMPVR